MRNITTHFVDAFFNEPKLILLSKFKLFQIFLYITNNSIYY